MDKNKAKEIKIQKMNDHKNRLAVQYGQGHHSKRIYTVYLCPKIDSMHERVNNSQMDKIIILDIMLWLRNDFV